MMMEIFLNEEKAKTNGIDINECYEIIDNFFADKGIVKIKQGIYWGEKNQKTFDAFSVMGTQLPLTDWFLKIADNCFWRSNSDNIEDREDCIKSFYEVQALLG